MGLPPTSTKGSGDANPVTTFEIDFPNIPVTHSGVKASVGTIPIAGGGTGQTTKQPAFDALSPLTTKGDLVTFSTVGARVGVGSNGQYLKADSSQTTGLVWAAGTNATLAVTSKTSNYSITTADDVVTADSSGGTFTLTLPTAVGNTGKVFYMKKTDTSLTAVTIATTSSQTIDGVVGSSLNTQYEQLQIVSDGANWQIIERYIYKGWNNFPSTAVGTLITGVTTNPTYGTVTENIARWRRVGDSMEIYWSYFQTTGGANGSGGYIFGLPAGVTANTTVAGTSGSSLTTIKGRVGTFSNVQPAGYFVSGGNVRIYSTTQLVVDEGSASSANTANAQLWGVGASASLFGSGNTGFGLNALVPITGWNG